MQSLHELMIACQRCHPCCVSDSPLLGTQQITCPGGQSQNVRLPMGEIESAGFPRLQQGVGTGCQVLKLCPRHAVVRS